MPTFHYVYIPVSETQSNEICIGQTNSLRRRLTQHSAGESRYTSKHRPWRICVAIAVPTRQRALALERYLKSQSGRAFISKRF